MNPIEKALAQADAIIAWDQDLTRTQAIAHAREVDTEVARLYNIAYDLRAQFDKTQDALEETQARIARYGDTFGRESEREERLQGRLGELGAQYRAARGVASEYNDLNYKGWSRFFFVQHIHSSMHCSSFRPTTRVGWLPDVSGLTEAEAVAAHGETLCTKCFPDAPVALTVKPADPNACPGTGVYIPRDQTAAGRGYYADCPECGKQVARVQGSGKIRKHKREEQR